MYRTDIQGLRAVAVTVVVLAHAGVPGTEGGFVGVDVFFVISGFLITGLLLAEHEREGGISLSRFWARRARRILPAATLVIAATAIASSIVLPVLERPAVLDDLLWAVVFAGNWRFVQQNTSYLAQDRAESPVLHYWSLGVEEQFYLVWPLVLVAVLAAAVRLGVGTTSRRRLALALVTAAAVAGSFALAVVQTGQNQPLAYFGSPTRAWQLGLGALLAIAQPLLSRQGPKIATALAGCGLLGLVWSVATLREVGGDTHYPGWLALVPTGSAVLLVAGGCGSGRTIVGRALSVAPARVVGDLSYSWYLWHFPFLVLGNAAWPAEETLAGNAVLAAAALAVSWLTYRYVEDPVRRWPALVRSRTRSLQLGVALTGLSLVLVVAIPLVSNEDRTVVTAMEGEKVTLRPAPAMASRDGGDDLVGTGCNLGVKETKPPSCDFADADSDHHVVLVGDSHAAMMFPPLERAARKLGWRLTSWTKNGCPMPDVTLHNPLHRRPYRECDQFRSAILDRIIEADPDLVFIGSDIGSEPRAVHDRETGEVVARDASYQLIEEGMRRTVSRLTDTGIEVVYMVDPPGSPFSPPSCLAESGEVAECRFDLPESHGRERETLRGTSGVRFLDVVRRICEADLCTPVDGDILIYRDKHHLTRTFALTFTSQVEELLEPSSGR
ncbi:acyltransferase family protein [Nocardioides speluncae]|uniref:acyltransferase family protein n=1 Tax=Nocardioides speluncae TaxID=2670337 RepID=UPI000D698539|nr:acyltransferase family protein [Nocardioides speluncae]